jgi:hypothetical protein
MKVSSAIANRSSSSARKEPPPPIPLQRPEVPELKKSEYLVMKLRTDPADPASQTYDLSIRYFRMGTPEEWLLFVRDLRRVLIGQNITTGPAKYAMIRRLISGDAEAVFNRAATNHGNETNANFELCLKDVTTHVFPQRALVHQRRHMRHKFKKPRDMTTRSFSARLVEINSYLAEFPPFEEGQMLPDEDMVDILEFSVPKAWQENMIIQGFEPALHTLNEVVEFCERHEFTEGQRGHFSDGATPQPGRQSGNTGAKSRAKSSAEASNKKRKSADKFCDLHQQAGHSTAECKVVQAQIKKMRSSWEAVRTSPQARQNWKKSNGGGSNKPPPSSKSSNNRETIMAMVKESLQEISSKKRKSKEVHFQNECSEEDFDGFSDIELSDDAKSYGEE